MLSEVTLSAFRRSRSLTVRLVHGFSAFLSPSSVSRLFEETWYTPHPFLPPVSPQALSPSSCGLLLFSLDFTPDDSLVFWSSAGLNRGAESEPRPSRFCSRGFFASFRVFDSCGSCRPLSALRPFRDCPDCQRFKPLLQQCLFRRSLWRREGLVSLS